MDLGALTNVAFAGVAVFGAVLTAFALAALRRVRSTRMALVATGFGLVTVQGIVIGASLFSGGVDVTTLLFLSAFFEAGLLLVFFLATLVR
jgi:hypothetical protein